MPFLKYASFRRRKRKAMKRIKQKYQISKKGNTKNEVLFSVVPTKGFTWPDCTLHSTVTCIQTPIQKNSWCSG